MPDLVPLITFLLCFVVVGLPTALFLVFLYTFAEAAAPKAAFMQGGHTVTHQHPPVSDIDYDSLMGDTPAPLSDVLTFLQDDTEDIAEPYLVNIIKRYLMTDDLWALFATHDHASIEEVLNGRVSDTDGTFYDTVFRAWNATLKSDHFGF